MLVEMACFAKVAGRTPPMLPAATSRCQRGRGSHWLGPAGDQRSKNPT